MTNKNPFGWDLPAGCTDVDIDKAFGDPKPKSCDCCGEKFIPNDKETKCEACEGLTSCCGVEYDKDIGICPQCKEHC